MKPAVVIFWRIGRCAPQPRRKDGATPKNAEMAYAKHDVATSFCRCAPNTHAIRLMHFLAAHSRSGKVDLASLGFSVAIICDFQLHRRRGWSVVLTSVDKCR